jgi:hypothetical protein
VSLLPVSLQEDYVAFENFKKSKKIFDDKQGGLAVSSFMKYGLREPSASFTASEDYAAFGHFANF